MPFQRTGDECRAGRGRACIVWGRFVKFEVVADPLEAACDTDIATGRPALPTPLGTTHVMAKYSPYEMVSPWPPGSPST